MTTQDLVLPAAAHAATVDAVTDAELDAALAAIPEDLRFETEEREGEGERLALSVGNQILYATRPKEFTMLSLAAAMSGMADGGDRAYAIMVFCYDTFDATGREILRNLSTERVFTIIEKICTHWGQDTSKWGKPGGNNRAERRAATTKKKR